MNKNFTGQFSLDKVLIDGRRSPTQLIPNPEKDVIIFDQHREVGENGDVTEYKKAVGVLKNARTVNGKFEFDWVITDSNIQNLVNESKYPKKLFTYSPEHIPINRTKEYDQGMYGIVDAIAITNLNNDDEAITTRIWNKIQETFKDNGDNMKEDKVIELIKNELEAYKPDTSKIDAFLDKIKDVDFEKLMELPSTLETISGEVEGIKGQMAGFVSQEDVEKEQMVQNIMAKTGFTKESIKNMKMDELKKLGEKFEVEFDGISEHNHRKPEKDIFDEILEDMGVDLRPKDK